MAKSVPLHQVLINAHGIAVEGDLGLDPLAVDLAGRGGGHPGGFCFLRDPADCLAVHPDHPCNLALRFARLQQRSYKNL